MGKYTSSRPFVRLAALIAVIVLVGCGTPGAGETTAGSPSAASASPEASAPATSQTAAASPQNLRRVTFMFPVFSAIQYHPFYIAQKLGYFAEEGLEMDSQITDGSSAAMQQLIAGNAIAALPSPGAYLNAVASGQDIRWVCSYEYNNVFAMGTPEDSGVTSIADLKGKSVGISEPSGGEVPLVRAALRDAGLTEGQDVQLVPIGEGGALTIEAIESGQVQAYASSVFDIAAVEAAGHPMNNIFPEELQSFPANGVVAKAETLESDPEVLIGICRALAKGMIFAENNQEAAKAIAAEVGPQEFENEAFATAGWEAIYGLLKRPADMPADAPLLAPYRPGWERYMNFLLQGSQEEGALAQPVDLDTAIDESLIDEINKFDRDAIVQQAQQYQGSE